MSPIISFGPCSYHIIYPLMFIISMAGINQLINLIGSRVQKEFFFFKSIGLMFLGEIVGGSLYFITRYQRKKGIFQSKADAQYYKTVPKLVAVLPERKYSIPLILLMLSLGGVDLGVTIISNYTAFELPKSSMALNHMIKPIQFFVYVLLSILILHQQIHSHHYTAIIINVLGVVLVIIPTIEEEMQWLNLLFFILRYFINAGLFVCDKWIMQFKEIHPFLLLLLQGIFGFSLFCIMLIFIYTLCPNDLPFKETAWYCHDIYFFSYVDSIGVVYLVVEFVKYIIINICIFQTINYFTPLYYLSANILTNFIYWLIDVGKDGSVFNAYTLFGYLMMMISFLVFNETIILHFWGLDFNTVKMITIRSQLNYEMETLGDFKDLMNLDK